MVVVIRIWFVRTSFEFCETCSCDRLVVIDAERWIQQVLGILIQNNFSSYILLHHVMGELDGRKNSWAYVEGGMGSVTEAIANCARSYGVQVHTESVSAESVYSSYFDGNVLTSAMLNCTL